MTSRIAPFISVSTGAWWDLRSRNGTCICILCCEVIHDSGRITCYRGMGRHVFGYDASSPNHCVFSNGDSSKQSGAGPDGRSTLYQSSLAGPVRLGLKLAGGGNCPRIPVVNKRYTVTDEHPGLDRDALTEERVAANLATVADFCPLLDLNERPYFGFVADLAAVKVHESPNLHVATQLHIGRDSLVIRSLVVHTGIGSACRTSLLHTRSPDENSGCDREKLIGAPWPF